MSSDFFHQAETASEFLQLHRRIRRLQVYKLRVFRALHNHRWNHAEKRGKSLRLKTSEDWRVQILEGNIDSRILLFIKCLYHFGQLPRIICLWKYVIEDYFTQILNGVTSQKGICGDIPA